MKKVIKIFSLSLALCISAATFAQDREHTLKVYNWADYIDEDLLGEFEEWYEQQTGEKVKVVYQLFDINEIMLAKIEKGHADYDVACPSDYIIERMLRNDLLLPINKDFGNTPSYLDNISPYIIDCFNKVDASGKNVNDYVVGYMWGTTGLLYNADKVDAADVQSWDALLNPKFAGQLLIKDAFRDVYSPLLMYLNYDKLQSGEVNVDDLMYDSTDESIAAVEELLNRIKPGVLGWEADFGKEMMSQGKALVNLLWSGDAQWAIEEAASVGINLNYVVPKEGSNVWFDGWVIPKYAKNVKAASYFINFMCMSENAVRNMKEIGYVSAVGTDEVLAQMQNAAIEDGYTDYYDVRYFFGPSADSVILNPVMYPNNDVIARCAMMHDTGDRTDVLLEMWSRVKGNNLNTTIIIILIVALAAAVGFSLYKKTTKKKRR